METSDLGPLLEDLTRNIDDLSASLSPLLSGPLSHQTSKLPLLDQAKLYVLATYAIESLLFSSLRLSGVDAKSHPVFKELARVKDYFGKIKAAENAGAGAKRNVSLDKETAGRFIKAGLAGNERFDRERAVRLEKERVGAKRKLEEIGVGTHTRLGGDVKRAKADQSKVEAEKSTDDEASSALKIVEGDLETSSGDEHMTEKQRRRKARKAMKTSGAVTGQSDDAQHERARPIDLTGDTSPASSPAAAADTTEALESLLEGALEGTPSKKKRKKRKKRSEVFQELEDERAAEMK